MSETAQVIDLASICLDFFDFDFGDEGMIISISSDAPDQLRKMIIASCGDDSNESIVQIYETLTCVVENESLDPSNIDKKVCSSSTFEKIISELCIVFNN